MSGPKELRNNGVVKYVGEAPQEELASGERSTRNRVARSILDHGPSTAADLAKRVGLTQAAVRRHLDALVSDDVVEAREQRVYGARTRGRPAKVFALTDCGRDAFDQSYDKLAVDALRWIADSGGDEALVAFARARMASQWETYRAAVDAAEPEARAEALAGALSADGYAATARSAPARSRVSSCASTTARSRTSPSSSRSCARRRRNSSPACSVPMCSVWPPSPTATACARRSSRAAAPQHHRPPHQHLQVRPGGTPHDAPYGDCPP